MWTKPVIRQIEQLQSSAGTGGSGKLRREPHRTAMTAALHLDHGPRLGRLLGCGQGGTAPWGVGAVPRGYDQRAAVTAIVAPRASARTASRCARALASVSSRHLRTSFLPSRSTSDAVPHTSRAAMASRRSSCAGLRRCQVEIAGPHQADVGLGTGGRFGQRRRGLDDAGGDQRGRQGDVDGFFHGRFLLFECRFARRDHPISPKFATNVSNDVAHPFCNIAEWPAMLDWNDLRYFLAVARGGSTLPPAGRCGSARPPSPAASQRSSRRSKLTLFEKRQAGYALTPRRRASCLPTPRRSRRPRSSSPTPPRPAPATSAAPSA